MEPRKAWFREYLVEWVQKNRKVQFASLNPAEKSKEMTRYYIQEIVAKLTPGLIPESSEDIDDYVVDGANDGGADFIYRSENTVLIVQSKFRASGKDEDAESVSYFRDVLQRLHNASTGKLKLNRKVMDAIGDIDWDTDHFDLRFLTLGRTSAPVESQAALGPRPVPLLKDLDERSELTLCNETELNKALREAISADQEPNRTVSIRFKPNDDDQCWIRYEAGNGRELYVGQVRGADLALLFRTEKYRLFTMNIRDYVGDTATNKGIVLTAKTKPNDFLFFNNGVSAVATRVEPDEKDSCVLHCDQFSIINGAQTVRSLYKAHDKLKDPLDDVGVMVRIMQFRFAKDGEFLADVTRFNNTQNSIKIADFRSNDPVQKNLRTRFAAISVGAKTCDYKNKRRRESDANKFSIGMEELAKTVHAFRYGPDDIYGGTRYLFDISPKGGYSKVYGEPVSNLTEDDFRALAGTYFLCHAVEESWKAHREAGEDDWSSPALERRWVVFYGIGELLRLIYKHVGKDLDSDLRYLANPNKWLTDPKSTTNDAIEELLDLAATPIARAYARVAAQPDFKHRNWFRSSQTLQDIRDELSVIPRYIRRREDFPVLRPGAKGAGA